MKIFSKAVLPVIILGGAVVLAGCVDKNKIKEELKEEMQKEQEVKQLADENQKLKEQLAAQEAEGAAASQAAAAAAAAASAAQQQAIQAKQAAQQTAATTVPDKIKIRNADNAGVVLRTSPSDASKITGRNGWNPHFKTGYVFDCVGVSGSYYKVYFEGDYYFIPQKYASPYSGSQSAGGPVDY